MNGGWKGERPLEQHHDVCRATPLASERSGARRGAGGAGMV